MPAKDSIHSPVRNALEKDGWAITADPLFLPVEGLSGLYIDLSAQNIISAEKKGEKIAIEIKGFGEQSLTQDFYLALGQTLVYKNALIEQDLDWPLFLAVPLEEFSRLEKVPLFIRVIERYGINILTVDIQTQTVVSWLIQTNIKK